MSSDHKAFCFVVIPLKHYDYDVAALFVLVFVFFSLCASIHCRIGGGCYSYLFQLFMRIEVKAHCLNN